MSLEELFIKAFDDESLQNIFFYELLNNDVYILAERMSNRTEIEDGEELNVVSLRQNDELFVPVFLSKSSLLYFLDGHNQQYMVVQGNDLFETIKDYNVVINPGQKDSMILYANEVKEVLSQSKN